MKTRPLNHLWKPWELDGYLMSVKDFLEMKENIPYDYILIRPKGKNNCLEEVNLKDLEEKFNDRKGQFCLYQDPDGEPREQLWFVVENSHGT